MTRALWLLLWIVSGQEDPAPTPHAHGSQGRLIRSERQARGALSVDSQGEVSTVDAEPEAWSQAADAAEMQQTDLPNASAVVSASNVSWAIGLANASANASAANISNASKNGSQNSSNISNAFKKGSQKSSSNTSKPNNRTSPPNGRDSSSHPRQMDKTVNISVTAPAVQQSAQFARETISQERQKLCPNQTADLQFQVVYAQVRVTEDIEVRLDVLLPPDSKGNRTILRGMRVMWTPDKTQTSNSEDAALSRVQLALELVTQQVQVPARAAKLVMPVAACSLLSNRSQALAAAARALSSGSGINSILQYEASLMEEAQREQTEGQTQLEVLEEVAAEAFRQRYMSARPLGIIIEKELESYRAGLKQSRSANLTFPQSFSWVTASPDCLDYIHNQGDCGACYMFAATDTTSDRHCINLNKTSMLGTVNHLSVQQALLCNMEGTECGGGWADVGFNFSVTSGDGVEADWEWERSCLSDSVCQFGSQCFTPNIQKCPGFFTPAELDSIITFEDALQALKARCALVPLKYACVAWATGLLGFAPTFIFLPGEPTCTQLMQGFKPFSNNTAGQSLLQEANASQEAIRDLATYRREGAANMSWLTDLWDAITFNRRRRSVSSHASSQTSSHSNSSTPSDDDDDDEVGNDDEDQISTGQSSAPATTANAARTASNCDRSRCPAAPAPHHLTSYHYLWNTVADFMQELYLYGPIYTSFYVYEDFTWFFSLFPQDGYTKQWGNQLGGHAVSVVGWDGNCTYHDGTSLAELEPEQPEPPLEQPEEQELDLEPEPMAELETHDRLRVRADTSRRRTARGSCWILRNTWGDQWGDAGYFKMQMDMLTGPDGVNLHIASAAGEGPWSVQ